MDAQFVTQAYGGTAGQTAGTFDCFDFGASQTGFEGTQFNFTQVKSALSCVGGVSYTRQTAWRSGSSFNEFVEMGSWTMVVL